MKILKAFLQHTDGIDRYLRDDECPQDLVRLCQELNEEDVIHKLSNSSIFHYRFMNDNRELWNITKTPFCKFIVAQAWEEDSGYPSANEVEVWLSNL